MKKILVVDDDERIRESFQFFFAASEYEIQTAANLGQAENILATQSIQAIILDLNIGLESGFSFLKKIRQTDQSIPIVVFSGAVSPSIEVELKEAKANEVVDKMHGIVRVMQKIAALLP